MVKSKFILYISALFDTDHTDRKGKWMTGSKGHRPALAQPTWLRTPPLYVEHALPDERYQSSPEVDSLTMCHVSVLSTRLQTKTLHRSTYCGLQSLYSVVISCIGSRYMASFLGVEWRVIFFGLEANPTNPCTVTFNLDFFCKATAACVTASTQSQQWHLRVKCLILTNGIDI